MHCPFLHRFGRTLHSSISVQKLLSMSCLSFKFNLFLLFHFCTVPHHHVSDRNFLPSPSLKMDLNEKPNIFQISLLFFAPTDSCCFTGHSGSSFANSKYTPHARQFFTTTSMSKIITNIKKYTLASASCVESTCKAL